MNRRCARALFAAGWLAYAAGAFGAPGRAQPAEGVV
jgi:hypothetical protein